MPGWKDAPLVGQSAGQGWQSAPLVDQMPPMPGPTQSSPLRDFTVGIENDLRAARQGVSPVVTNSKGEYLYQPLGELQLLDSGKSVKDFNTGKYYPLDPKTMFVLTDPSTGKETAYARNKQGEEGLVTRAGRWLSFGALSTSPISSAGTGAGAAAKIAEKGIEKATTPSMRDMAGTFKDVGVDPSISLVAQSRGAKSVSNILGDVPVVGKPLEERFKTAVNQLSQSVEKVASQFGTAKTPREAGRVIQGSVETYAKGSKDPGPAWWSLSQPSRVTSFDEKAGALFDRVAKVIPDSVQIDVTPTINALKGANSRYALEPLNTQQANPVLVKWQQILEKNGGKLSWSDARNLRTDLRYMQRDPQLRGAIPDAQLQSVIGGLTDSLTAGAAASGPEALKAFQQADKFYAVGMDRINTSLKSFFKAPSEEAAYAALEAAARNTGSRADAGKLFALKRSMPEEDFGNVASVVIRDLGKPAARATPEPGMADFSVPEFLANYNKLSNEAKTALFNGSGRGHLRVQLDKIAEVANQLRANQKLGNPSGSGRYVTSAMVGTGLYTDPVSTIGTLILARLGTAALASPRVLDAGAPLGKLLDWAAQTDRIALKNPEEWLKQFGKLDGIVRSNPQLAPFVQDLISGFRSSPGLAPADEAQPSRK